MYFKALLVVFSVLFCGVLTAHAGNVPQAANADSVGGCTTTAITQAGNSIPHGASVVQLQGGTTAGTNSTIQIFQKASGTNQGAYRTPSGKVFHVYGGCFYTENSAGDIITIAQSTAAPTQGGSTGSPPAGSVYFNGAGSVSSAANVKTSAIRPVAANTWYWIPLNGMSFGTVAAQYYPYWVVSTATASQGANVILFGWEDAIDN